MASLGRTQETNTSPGPSWSGGAGGGGGRHGLPELASPASTLCPRRAFPRSTGRGRGTVFPPSAACLGVPAPALFSCEIEGLSPDGGAGTRLDTGSQDSPPPPSPLSALPALFLFFPANPSGSPPHRTVACWGLGPGNQVGCRPPREIWVSDKQLIFAGTSVAHILCAVCGSPTHGGWGGCQWGAQGPQPLGPSQPGTWWQGQWAIFVLPCLFQGGSPYSWGCLRRPGEHRKRGDNWGRALGQGRERCL